MAKGTEYPGFETLGADIKEARKALGLSRRALAEQVSIDPRYLANIENSGDLPSVPVLYELARICKLPIERYFHPEAEPAGEQITPEDRPQIKAVSRTVFADYRGSH